MRKVARPGRRRLLQKRSARKEIEDTLSHTCPETRSSEFREGQRVDLLVTSETVIGYNAIIDDSGVGLLYKNEIFQALRRGQHIGGFIKKVREDGKIDLCLHKPGPEKIDEVSEKIINALKAKGGFMPVTDSTPPEKIYSLFGVSKKTYKKAVGALYRKRSILIEKDGIRLVTHRATD